MKYTLAIAALLVAGTAFADEGRISQSQLADFGLPGMTAVSDAQGQEIRGQGFAYTSSTSASALPGTYTHNHATALGFNHSESATGAASTLELEVLVDGIGYGRFRRYGRPGPDFSLQVKAAVGSAGFAIANAH